MTTPIIKQAELQSKDANVYLYQFSYKGELGMKMKLPKFKGKKNNLKNALLIML